MKLFSFIVFFLPSVVYLCNALDYRNVDVVDVSLLREKRIIQVCL